MVARFAGILEGILREEPLGCPDPAAAAGAIYAAIQGCFMLAATSRALIPRGSAAPAVRRMARTFLGLAANKGEEAP